MNTNIGAPTVRTFPATPSHYTPPCQTTPSHFPTILHHTLPATSPPQKTTPHHYFPSVPDKDACHTPFCVSVSQSCTQILLPQPQQPHPNPQHSSLYPYIPRQRVGLTPQWPGCLCTVDVFSIGRLAGWLLLLLLGRGSKEREQQHEE